MSRIEQLFTRLQYLGAGSIVLGLIASRFIFVVDGGERAIIFDKIRGVQNQVKGEGMHFRIPIIQVSNNYP